MAVAKPVETLQRPMTEDEFMNLPHDGKYELVNGEARRVPASFTHDVIGANVIVLIAPHAKGIGFIAGAQAGFRMKNGNIRCPDVSFTRKSRLPDEKPIKGFVGFAPDLAVEIISSSEDRQDMADKVREYFDAGAAAVWQLFPESETVRVFISPDSFTDLQAADEIIGGDFLPTFRCRVSELFALE